MTDPAILLNRSRFLDASVNSIITITRIEAMTTGITGSNRNTPRATTA